MEKELQDFDHEWRHGDRVKARAMALAYIEVHRARLQPLLEQQTREELVRMVSAYRRLAREADVNDRKMEADRIVVDMWLLAEYQPQQITGEAHIELPSPAAYHN